MADEIVNSEIFLEKEILAPYTHIFQSDVKHIRKKIISTFNHWLKLPKEKLDYIECSVNMIYSAGLIIDDIQDNSTIRRCIPAAHCVYGIPLTINAGLHVMLLATGRFLQIQPKAIEIYQQHFLEVLRGQSTELYWRDNSICPTEDQYRYMLRQKNGRMFSMAVCMMQLVSEVNIDCLELVLVLGEYFQLREDYLNLVCQEELEEFPKESKSINNSFCEDITEGKFTLPVIHAMGTPQAQQIRNILQQRTSDIHLKKYCMSLLEKSGSLQYTNKVLRELDLKIREMVKHLGGNPEMEAMLDELLATMV